MESAYIHTNVKINMGYSIFQAYNVFFKSRFKQVGITSILMYTFCLMMMVYVHVCTSNFNVSSYEIKQICYNTRYLQHNYHIGGKLNPNRDISFIHQIVKVERSKCIIGKLKSLWNKDLRSTTKA